MEKCPKCGSTLNVDEKASGKCFSCGTNFESSLPISKKKYNTKNTISVIIKIIGIAIIVIGTVFSFANASDREVYYNFSLSLFITPFIFSFISGILLLSLSEIIQLLEDIKNK